MNTVEAIRIKPLRDLVLLEVQQSSESTTSGGLVIPKTSDNDRFSRGLILDIGPEVQQEGGSTDDAIRLGRQVFFDARMAQAIDHNQNIVLVPISAIIAGADAASPATYPIPISKFFSLPSWEDFAGADHNIWANWQDITHFSLKVDFLESFGSLRDLGRRAYESCVESVRGITKLDMSSLNFIEKDGDYLTVISDDLWGCGINVSTKPPTIELQQKKPILRGYTKRSQDCLLA